MRLAFPNTIWRSLRIAEHVLTGTILAAAVLIGRPFGLTRERVQDLTRWWHARLCRLLALRVEVTGDLAPAAMLVANHVSWLDVPVVGARGRIGFLSKAEVRGWPLVGWMARASGTLFIARGANETNELIQRIGERVRSGAAVVVFPEGTTTDGCRVERFHPRLFAAAQIPGVKVQPVAIGYGAKVAPDPIAPFIGADSLLPHLLRLIRHPGVRVRLHLLPPIDGGDLSRRQLAEQCRAAIAGALGVDATSLSMVSRGRDPANPLPCAAIPNVRAA